jgi:hypothetical protein
MHGVVDQRRLEVRGCPADVLGGGGMRAPLAVLPAKPWVLSARSPSAVKTGTASVAAPTYRYTACAPTRIKLPR